MVSTGIIVVLRIVCMCLTIAYGLVSLGHITATWMLRKDLYFAVRVGSFMVIVAMIESLITLGASLVLFGKLRRTNDIFEVSLEIRKVGACALLTTVKVDETLQQILLSTPLLQAFEEYCLRALCGEDVVAASLDGAAKEVGMMLKDKLFDRFRETDQFKQITAKSALKAPGDVIPESYGNAVNVNDRHPS
ncbi:hypothetical protein Esi_0036_0046 [Ectocarpus siliculosus]|uniref:Uncharacterized protein n=1 Tax=Ectocarpus siliculosus TaxID=2880 RepID=D8LLA8_ECTSI|nr:hypothetical protein Esi_0036_0046 [Ectocarpus siliculosus]|eukprot:CBN77106.1 hypothetical protein Esi_0036_0046 [Ectocarpus siliculosus]